jgi:hypothetical protein
MVGVAVLACLICGAQTVSRWRLYRKLARSHAAHEMRIRAEVAPSLEFRREYGTLGCGVFSAGVEADCERAEWHCQLKLKYEMAARHPWLSVEPDLPEPK